MSQPAIPPKQFWDDYDWANSHYGDLLKAYDNQWVGIYHKKVVAADPDIGRVETRLQKVCPNQEVPLLFIADASHIY